MAFSDNREPYHFMDTSIRITTAAEIRTREGSNLTDLLAVTEVVGGASRHAVNELSIWLGNQSDPESVVTVCDRLIAVLTKIRQRNADLCTACGGDHDRIDPITTPCDLAGERSAVNVDSDRITPPLPEGVLFAGTVGQFLDEIGA
jgi:hypothetical protein